MSTSPTVKRISRFIVAGVVLSALGFGASTLLARDMPYCHGYTDTEADCIQLCVQLFPENGGQEVWHESTGCCVCAER